MNSSSTLVLTFSDAAAEGGRARAVLRLGLSKGLLFFPGLGLPFLLFPLGEAPFLAFNLGDGEAATFFVPGLGDWSAAFEAVPPLVAPLASPLLPFLPFLSPPFFVNFLSLGRVWSRGRAPPSFTRFVLSS